MSEKPAEDDVFLVGSVEQTLQIPGSRPFKCVKCGATCMISPSGQKRMPRDIAGRPNVLCLSCSGVQPGSLKEAFEHNEKIFPGVTAEQVRELALTTAIWTKRN